MWKISCFGLKWGQDLENGTAHPHQVFPGVPPPPGMRINSHFHINDINRAFSHDVTAAILVFQNNETAAKLVPDQDNPVRVEFFSYGNVFFCFNKFA